MAESPFNKRLKTLSKIALKTIIRGTGLKEQYEIVLWKYYIEQKSYVEIADELGIEYPSVGKILWKAKKELQRIIDNEKTFMPAEIQNYISLLLDDHSKENK